MRTNLKLTAMLAGLGVALGGCVAAPPPVAVVPGAAGPSNPGAYASTGTATGANVAAPGQQNGAAAPDGSPVQVPLVAVPGPNKTPAQFAADDAACRANPRPAGPASRTAPAANYPSLAQGADPASDSPGVGYLRCMASRNDTVEPIEEPEPLPVFGYYPAYPVYAGYDYGFPVFYDGFFGLGFFVGFGGFYHHGFYPGFYGRYGYRDFGRGGFYGGGFRGGEGFRGGGGFRGAGFGGGPRFGGGGFGGGHGGR